MDASKAFDKVHYGTMFSILLNKNVPYCIIRLLMDSYVRQEARVIWNSCHSTYFRLMNGVKQGGVLSPTLFNLYIDRLLITLKNSGLGCHINGTYMGALSYADDITLSCPSVHGLNKMMSICSDFATNNFITFNAKKTICIKYGESVRLTEHVILDGNVISWHNGVRHLGNFLSSRLDINVDTNHKCSHFIGHFNHMMSNFGHLNHESVGTLFKSYCCSFYGSFLWKYNSDSFGKCCTQWNKCIRRIYSLPYNTHRWLLGPLIGQYHIRHQLILRDIKFLHSLLQSTNYIVRQCIMNASSNANTLIGYKMSYYRSMYGIDICNADLNYCLLRARARPLCLTPDQHAHVNCLYELSLAKSNHRIIDGFDPDEITDIINAIATG